jgi:site-specific recombinase XerD
MTYSKLDYVFNRKNQLNKKGLGLVQLRIYLKGKNSYLSTGIYVLPTEWNDKKKEVTSKNASYENHNLYLKDMLSKIKAIESKFLLTDLEYNGNMVIEAFSTRLTTSYLEFCRKEILKHSYKSATINNHKATFSLLDKYEAQKSKQLTFQGITLDFLQDFDQFCKGLGLSGASISRHHQTIKSYLNHAINKQLFEVKNYPYRHYKIKSYKSKIEALTQLQLDILVSEYYDTYQDITTVESKVLKMFLFGCYTGLRYSDITNLKYSNIKVVENQLYICIKTSKSEKETNINITVLWGGVAVNLLEIDGALPSDKKIFESYSNVYVNKILKKIAEKVEIETNLHFHVSRHTFGTLLLENGLSLPLIQRLMQHSSINTTQIYAEMRDTELQNQLIKAFS